MFGGCKHLQKVPKDFFPSGMTACKHTFKQTSLQEVPDLPVKLVDGSYLFDHANNSYGANFRGNDIPESAWNEWGNIDSLPSGLIYGSCMFNGQHKLYKIPELPECLQNGSYMFEHIGDGPRNSTHPKMIEEPDHFPSALTNADFMFYDIALSATPRFDTLTKSCSFHSCFQSCSELTTCKPLSDKINNATMMFAGCTNLTSAIRIPSSLTTLSGMFNTCRKINQITADWQNWPGTDSNHPNGQPNVNTKSWLDGVSGQGDFWCHQSIYDKLLDNSVLSRGPNTVPAGWDLHNIDE